MFKSRTCRGCAEALGGNRDVPSPWGRWTEHVGKCLITGSMWEKALVYGICPFPCCQHSHLSGF